MADVDPHTLATFAFAQLQRDPSFRRRFPSLRNVYVCIESDLIEDVRRQAQEHFPKVARSRATSPETTGSCSSATGARVD